MPVSAAAAAPGQLHSLLRCPSCRGLLDWSLHEVRCSGCAVAYRLEDGIPVFAEPRPEDGPEAAYKAAQIEFFDGESEEFEISRPAGTTRLYRWLIDEKQRRPLRGVEHLLPGASVLVVCAGSGMDAEYLARAGARVIISDISLGAVRRARERSRRGGLPTLVIVADAERLPFGDATIDFVWVHDGLHHLADPYLGVEEMARVARRHVCITEPARAAATALAAKLGIALEREEAGNRVERLEPDRLGRCLLASGFEIELCERYAMYYSHRPGSPSRMLSRPRLFGPATAGLAAANLAIGRFGNKLGARAARTDGAHTVVP